jgi:hypothetical protein
MSVNEAFGWMWILAGVVSGLALGLGFHRDEWLGGYGSFRRRLIRLGHISFFGLGILNILFAVSGPRLALGTSGSGLASLSLIVGGITMPACCGLMAWRRGFYLLFAVPVASLVLGVGLTVMGILRR